MNNQYKIFFAATDKLYQLLQNKMMQTVFTNFHKKMKVMNLQYFAF